MDKIMSARLDESVIRHISMLAEKLGTSKKAVLESAVRCYVEKVEKDRGYDVLTDTLGSWRRDESPAETVRHIKRTMRSSQSRYKR